MAREYALTVDVPDFDEAAAYNHDRPISGLIRTQLHHLHIAEQHLPAAQRTNVNINNLHTEREAGEYIARITALLHKFGESAKPKNSGKKRTKSVKKSAGDAGKKAKSAGKKTSKNKPAAGKRR